MAEEAEVRERRGEVARRVEELLEEARRAEAEAPKGLAGFLVELGGRVIMAIERLGGATEKAAVKTKEVTSGVASKVKLPKIEGEISPPVPLAPPKITRKREVEDAIVRRLMELKELQRRYEEGEIILEEEEEEEEWERVELERPLLERLADMFYKPFGGVATSLVKFFTGLDEDLYKANIRLTPVRYVAVILFVAAVAAGLFFLLTTLFISPILAVPMGALGGLLGFFVARMYPRIRAKARVADMERNLPYVLRHMATQLSAGIGLYESITSVAMAGYGAMSEEFQRVLLDINRGLTVEDAITRMMQRVDSDYVRRALRQIDRALRTGADVGETLKSLAEEVSFELRMKLRDYTQTLNVMAMMYMMMSVVLPVLLAVIIIAISIFSKALIFSPEVIFIVYVVLLPFMLFYFGIMIKRMEPT